MKHLDRPFFLVYEFVANAQSLPEFLLTNYAKQPQQTSSATTPAPPAMPDKNRKNLFRQIGSLAAVDMLINNSDRFPLHCNNNVIYFFIFLFCF